MWGNPIASSDPGRSSDPRSGFATGSDVQLYFAEQRVLAEHPSQPVRAMGDRALLASSPRFAELYSPIGRPGIPPERLLRALLLQVLYTIRSERLLMEPLDYNLLFRWFVDLNMDDAVCGAAAHSTPSGSTWTWNAA